MTLLDAVTTDVDRARIDAALTRFLDDNSGMLAGHLDDLRQLVDSACAYVRSGGKRLRPLFCIWGFRAAGGVDDTAVVTAAASLELIQACALAHDDLIDASERRRGRPALHREWEQRHIDQGWDGDPQRFGMAAAILIGDLFLAWSDAMFSGCGLDPAELARARPVWDLMRSEVMAGQYLDLVEQVRGEFAAARSLHVAALKSGRYSVERPLLLGAAIAGADPELTAGLSAVGYDVGVAFQLRDDLLGVFGDPGLTGKPAGDDLREGKRTVLVALADKQGDPRQRALLRRELGRPTLDDGLIGQLQAVLIDTGAVDAVERMIAECADRARTRLAALPCDPVARHQLQQLADAALHRYR